MPDDRYDIIIIGSGAGGGTIAHALAGSSARILIVERGDFVPQEEDNWSPEAVWLDRRYRAKDVWLDAGANEFVPYTHYCVGGNTKFWGCVLYRLRQEDFQEVQHAEGISPAWPIDYDTLAPYYDRAELLYRVRGDHRFDPTEPPRRPFPYPAVPHSERMAEIVDQLTKAGLNPSPLPLGVSRPMEPGGCQLCDTCNSYPCKVHAKSDADVCCIRPLATSPNVTLWTNAEALTIETDATGRKASAVNVKRAGATHRVEASIVIVSCGAVNSAALLLRSANARHAKGLANSSGLVGKRYMAHLTTMISAWTTKKNLKGEQRFQKTVAVNDFYRPGRAPYPLGHIQSQGRIHPAMVYGGAPRKYHKIAAITPGWLMQAWTDRSVEWLAMTEDLPSLENEVTVENGRIRVRYKPHNMTAHRRLVEETRRLLGELGFLYAWPESFGTSNTTHQCGTACFGTDPRKSVLDPWCRTHDVENLFVVDASFFPSSAAVNPGLTIVAQALRVADHIKDVDLR